MHGESGHGHSEQLFFAVTLLFIVLMVLAGRAGAIVQRRGLPAVLGELLAGITLFNVAMMAGFTRIVDLRDSSLVEFFAFVGVVLLLFKTGLKESLEEMMEVGIRSIIVATVGVVLPFVGGYAVSTMLFPEAPTVTHVFIGATLVATSVGITAKMFEDLNYDGLTKRLVIGAAVVDDVIGLIVLAVVSVIAAGGNVSAELVAKTTGGAVAFLVVSVAVGVLVAPLVGKFLSRIHTGVGMKQAMALLFCATFAWAAMATVELEPIVGAFAAGLVLTHVHFKDFDLSNQVTLLERWMDKLPSDQLRLWNEMDQQKRLKEDSHVEHLIEGVARFFVPVFFVHTGMGVNVAVFGDLNTVITATAIAVVAILGKLACGLVAGKANKAVTGWAMVARGEVGLVFATLGHDKGVFSDQIFAVAVTVVVITTFVPPIILPRLVRREVEGRVTKTAHPQTEVA